MPDLSPQDLDLIARTALAEGGNDGDAGMAAVANVIRNRVQSGQFGDSVGTVVHQPGAFEAWSLGRRDPNYPGGFSTRDPNYQRARQVAQSVFAGQTPDATRGALYYYNPSLQAALGRQPPAFAQGTPLATIGRQQFYGGNVSPSGFDRVILPGDISDTARALGLGTDNSATAVAPPPVPAASPFGNAAVTPDDVQATAQALGLGPVPKSALPAPLAGAPVGTPHATPAVAAAASRILPQYDIGSAVVEGMPIIGPASTAGFSALTAALSPNYFNPNAPATFGERFSQNQLIQEEAQRQWDAAHPFQAFSGNLAGGAMTYGPLATTTAGKILLGLPNATRLGATVGGRVYTGAAGNALIGGLDAALRGQNPATGAEVQGAIGAAAPLVGESVGRGATALLPWLSQPDPALSGINNVGRNWLATALANETPTSIAAARERMGPYGFLADLNPNLTNLAAGVASRAEPPGSAAIGEAYRIRDAAQRGVIDDALTHAYGNPVDTVQFERMIAQNRAAAADPLYEQWRSMQVHPTPELQALIPRLDAAGAFDQAHFLAGIDGIDINKNFFVGGPQKSFPTTQTWDYVKRALDSKIDQAYSGGDNTTASKLVNLRSNLIGAIENTDAGQVWKQARSEFADRSQLIDQIRAGRDDFLGARSGLSVDELRDELSGLSGPELQARLIGQRSAAAETMGATVNGDTVLRNKFLAPNNQDKLRLTLGDQNAGDLISTLEQQQYLSGQNRYVNPRAGSATAPRSAAMAALEPPSLPEWNPNLTQPLSFIPPSWIEAMRPASVLQGGREQAYGQARQQIVPALLSRGTGIDALVKAIGKVASQHAAAARIGTNANALTTLLLAGPGAETMRLRGGFQVPSPMLPAF